MASYKSLRIAAAFCFIVFAFMGEPKLALADCTSPAGIGGTITWNGTDSVIWCDGTNWYALKNAAGASGTAGYIQFSNGSGGFSNSGTSADDQLFWDNTNKRLGIGTAAPLSKVEIVRDNATTNAYATILTLTKATTGTAAAGHGGTLLYRVERADGGWADAAAVVGLLTGVGTSSSTNGALAFHTATNSTSNSEKMRITYDGNVGIGTASPTYLLSLGGEAARTVGMERTSAGTNGYALTLQAGGAKSATADLSGGDLTLSSGTATGTGSSNITFQTATAGATATTDRAPSTKMTILGNGNVGIGTTVPSSPLSVSTAVGTTGGIAVTDAADGNNPRVRLRTSAPNGHGLIEILDNTETVTFLMHSNGDSYYNGAGNFGIGTASPTYLLSLGGESARTVGMERTTSGTTGYSLTVMSGGAKSATADLNGGDLTLSAGTATGTGSSNIYFQTATAGSTATTDRTASTKMTILGNGNVGIGTTSPTNALTLPAASTGIALYNTADQTTNYERGTLAWDSNVLRLTTQPGGTGAMRGIQFSALNAAGNGSTLGIGTSFGFTYYQNTSSAGTNVQFSNNSSNGMNASSGTQNFFVINPYAAQSGTAGYRALLVNPTENSIGSGSNYIADFQIGGVSKMAITNAGNVLIGRTTTSSSSTPAALTIQHTYGVNYGLVLVSDNVGTSSVARFDNPNGNVGSIVISGTSTTYTTTSDRRLKENITDTQDALAKVMRIPVRDFSFKSDSAHAKQTGFIAQELADVMPEAVATNGGDGEAPLANGKQAWSVDYGRVTPLLLKAIQELKAANDNLRQTVEAQGREIDTLKARRP